MKNNTPQFFVYCIATHLFIIAESNLVDSLSKLSLSELRYRRHFRDHPRYRKEYDTLVKKKSEDEAKILTQQLLDKRIKKCRYLEEEHNFISPESTFENLLTTETYDIGGSDVNKSLATSGLDNKLSLDNFFARPVHISTITFTQGVSSLSIINIIRNWSLDNTVRAKLSNYSYFRGKFHVNLTLASSRFHYGSLLVSYQPHSEFNAALIGLENMFINNSNDIKMMNARLSQSPGNKIMYFGVDNSLSLDIPLIIPKQGLKMFNSNGLVISSGADIEAFTMLGELYVSTLNQMQVSNEDFASTSTLQIYAYVTDVELSAPTASDFNITAESSFDTFRSTVNTNPDLLNAASLVKDIVADEYSNAGPVTQIASAVSNISNKFSSIPIIGSLAKATSIASGFAAKFLNKFGFSKPINIDPVIVAKNVAFSNSSYGTDKTVTTKLTLDPKQELTVQSFSNHTNLDELAIKYITSIDSYFHTASWFATQTPRVTNIAIIPVTPLLTTSAVTVAPAQTIVQPTALAYAALPFRYWRGTITLRFEIVCSSFHRGKLMFVYEPNGFALALLNAVAFDFNQNYIKIVDIEEVRHVEFQIGFLHDRLFASVWPDTIQEFENSILTPASVHSSYNYIDADIPAFKSLYDKEQSIGNIFIRPFTSLVTPSDATNGSRCFINCYVKSTDMEFAGPIPMDRLAWQANAADPESSLVLAESSLDIGFTLDKKVTYKLNEVTNVDEGLYLYHFGESVQSFRTLLKRDNTVWANVGTTTAKADKITIPIYPLFASGDIPTFGGTSIVNVQANRVFSLFHYLRLGFNYMKGGFRYKQYDMKEDVTSEFCVVRKCMMDFDESITHATLASTNNIALTNAGSLLTSGKSSRGLDFEIPFTTSDLFVISNSNYSTQVITNNEFVTHFSHTIPGAQIFIGNFFTGITSDTYVMFLSGSIAEDFTMFYFNGAPFHKL